MAKTRCWVTGVELGRGEGRVLNQVVAVALRQQLAAKVAVLDQVLAAVGGMAGHSERALELGVRPWHRRVVSTFVADGHSAMFAEPQLFSTEDEAIAQSAARQRLLAEQHPWIGARVKALSPAEWALVRGRLPSARAGLNSAQTLAMRRAGLDIALALAAGPEEPGGIQRWLRSGGAEELVDRLAPPAGERAAIAELLAQRLAVPADHASEASQAEGLDPGLP
jgi:hypothetical protein